MRYIQKFAPGNIVLWSNIVHKNKEMKVVQSWESDGEPRMVLLTDIDGEGKCYPVSISEVTKISDGEPYKFQRPAPRPAPLTEKEEVWVLRAGNGEVWDD